MGGCGRCSAERVSLDQMHENSRATPRIWQPDWLVMRAMARALRGLLAGPALRLRDARILDFGCGARPYEQWFGELGAHYRGADIEGAHEVGIRADGTLDCGDGEYDMVASFQVLEHVWDVVTYLREARRALRKDGWLLLSTHGAWLYHPHPHDYRRWTGEGLRREVEAQGFRLARMEALVGPLAWTTVFRSLAAAQLLRGVPLIGTLLQPPVTVALNLWAWLEDHITPEYITANNACVYVGLFNRNG
jgi:SAM-dependent methyltransferase